MIMRAALGVLVLVFLNYSILAASVKINSERLAVVDGKPTFVIGLYENPGDDATLEQVAKAGFNLVRASADKAALDRLAAHKLYAWINTGPCVDLSTDRDGRENRMRDLVATCAGHPALLVWEVPDEALWNCWHLPMGWRRGKEPAQQRAQIDALEDKALADALRVQRAEADRLFDRGDFAGFDRLADDIWRKLGMEPPHPELSITQAPQRTEELCAGMRAGYALLRGLDPEHPVWMNHAPRNQHAQLTAYGQAADIVGCDIYPVPQYEVGHSDLGDRSLSSVGAYTEIMQRGAPGKPVWMVLQGFGWADLVDNPSAEDREKRRRPDLDESRFMAYDAIVRGARGILYWGTYRIEKDSALWQDLMKLARELADLAPVLAAPDAPLELKVELAPTWGSVDRGVRVLPKRVDDKTWFLVVNEFTDPLHYTIHDLASLEGTTYTDPGDAREAVVADGKLALSISGHGVQVLAPGAEE